MHEAPRDCEFMTASAAVAAIVSSAAKLGNGTVAMTVATYDYAEGALLWYYDLVRPGAVLCSGPHSLYIHL